jgi:hypothetical protein
MSATKSIAIYLELSDDDAHLIAVFLRRAGFSTYRAHARNDDEAYAMFSAAESLRRAVCAAGFDPR